MNTLLIIMIVAGALATLFVLTRGVLAMAQGRDFSGQRSQNLMRKRVMYQAATILFVVLLLMLTGNGGS